jgi:hypothetical protein
MRQAGQVCQARQILLSGTPSNGKGRADMTSFAMLTSAAFAGVFTGAPTGVLKRR